MPSGVVRRRPHDEVTGQSNRTADDPVPRVLPVVDGEQRLSVVEPRVREQQSAVGGPAAERQLVDELERGRLVAGGRVHAVPARRGPPHEQPPVSVGAEVEEVSGARAHDHRRRREVTAEGVPPTVVRRPPPSPV